MKPEENIEEIYTKEEDIKKITEKLKRFSFDKLKKRKYYEVSVLEKNTNEKELADYFPKFDKIKMIFHRKRPSGYDNYDLHYEKRDGTYLVYAINLDKYPPELINAFAAEKNFKNFSKIIAKKYWQKMI
ncbi:MAG: hypothetical protein KKD18_02885 [Nanoarchaeota archaeon]|nr:hypothetical protein [Nanoarchaeota archaeon]MBU0977335.1 hypothetical protein [Nanoarchaeota archaeon]